MLKCPACGTESLEGVPECPRCHLSARLFDAVKEAAGDQDQDPSYLKTVSEIMAIVDASDPSGRIPTPAGVDGLLSRPARFPAPPAPRAPISSAHRAPSVEPLVRLPALPPAPDVPVLKRQVAEFLQLGRRQGLNVTEFDLRAGPALIADDRATLEAVARELFVRLTAAFTEDFESLRSRRNDLSPQIPTGTLDAELEGCRNALAIGDLGGLQRRLRRVEQEFNELEEHWEVVQILTTECDLMVETLEELGGDPGPAVGPRDEGRRLVASGQRNEAERVLARAAFALWAILHPLLLRELRRFKELILEQRSEGTSTESAVAELRALAVELGRRNFAGVITAYRRLKGLLEQPSAGVRGPSAQVVVADDVRRPE